MLFFAYSHPICALYAQFIDIYNLPKVQLCIHQILWGFRLSECCGLCGYPCWMNIQCDVLLLTLSHAFCGCLNYFLIEIDIVQTIYRKNHHEKFKDKNICRKQSLHMTTMLLILDQLVNARVSLQCLRNLDYVYL